MEKELKVTKMVKELKETKKVKETVETCYVDCRFAVKKEHLPETNKQSEIFNQWEKNVAMSDFFNADLFVGVDTVEGLPTLNVTHQPEKYSVKLPIEKFELGTNGKFFFEPNNQVWYEEEQANAECKNDLYQVDFAVCKLFTEIHFQCAIYKVR